MERVKSGRGPFRRSERTGSRDNAFTKDHHPLRRHLRKAIRCRRWGRRRRLDGQMTSWRDDASAEAQQDLDELLSASLGFAQQQLAEHGEFFPYSVVVRDDGPIEMVAAVPDIGNDRPASADVIASCQAALLEQRSRLRAASIVADVALPEAGGDAIQVQLEHAEGQALLVLLPYSKQEDSVEYGQLQASGGQRFIWAA